MSADSIRAIMAFVYYLEAEENVAELLSQCHRENSSFVLQIKKCVVANVSNYNFSSVSLFHMKFCQYIKYCMYHH